MAAITVAERESYASVLLRNRKFVVGASIILLFIAVAVVGELFVLPGQRASGNLPSRLPPGPDVLLGTDSLGRSVAIQMTEAVPNSLQVGF
ncbi:MAG TPA: hypothetical protein VF177_11765, partial [Anaerolineae bacterium]